MPGEPVSAAVLAAFKIGCVVTAWNNYNLEFLNIAYGIDVPNAQVSDVLGSPNAASAQIGIAKLEVSGYHGSAKMAGLAWSAFSHKDNIAKFTAAINEAEHCGVMTAASGWLPGIVDASYAAANAVPGLNGLIDSGRAAPNPDAGYDSAFGATDNADNIDRTSECSVFIDAGAGNDLITASDCDDKVLAGIGNDELRGMGGSDYLIGGAGNDTYYLDSLSADIVSDFGLANDYDVIVLESERREDIELATLQDSPTDLVIHFKSTGQYTLLAKALDFNGINAIEEIRFSDGDSMVLADVASTFSPLQKIDSVEQNVPLRWDVTNSDNPASIDTSTGQKLSVEILSPKGEIEQAEQIQLTGVAGIGEQLNARTSIIYLIDISGSTEEDGNDCNADGIVNELDNYAVNDPGIGTIFDCEIAGVQALNRSFGDNPDIDVGVVAFETGVLQDYLFDLVSPPNKDSDNNGISDIDEYLQNLSRSRILGWGGTNFNTALSQARSVLNRSNSAQNIVYMFTDGKTENSITSTASAVAESNITVNTFGIGEEAEGCENTQIQEIAEITGGDCRSVDTPSQLAATIDTVVLSAPAAIEKVTVAVNGATEQNVTVDNIGGWELVINASELTSNTNVIAVTAYGNDATQVTAEIVLTTNDIDNSDNNNTDNSTNSTSGDTSNPSTKSGGGITSWFPLSMLLLAVFYRRLRRRS